LTLYSVNRSDTPKFFSESLDYGYEKLVQ